MDKCLRWTDLCFCIPLDTSIRHITRLDFLYLVECCSKTTVTITDRSTIVLLMIVQENDFVTNYSGC